MDEADLLLQILQELRDIKAEVSVCQARLGYYKWNMQIIWGSLLALTATVVTIAFRI